MLKRTVQINGALYDEHRVTRLDSHIGGSTIGYVRSENSTDGYSVTRSYALDYKDGMTVKDAEDKLWSLSAFEEYVDSEALLDEVLPYINDEQAVEITDVFPAWKVGKEYSVGYRVNYQSVLYKCLQAHMSQEEWTPDTAASLWAKLLNPDPEVIPVWEQPDSTNPYMTGDKVHYPDADGPVYESLIDNNTWSPEAYPAGWQLVEGGE